MKELARWNSEWALYLVADEIHFRKGLIEDSIVRAIQGGIQVLQLREKHCSDQEFIELARRVLRAVRPYQIPIIINDRIEVALATGAHGVHLGQKDALPSQARETLGANALIGWSVESEDHALRANSMDVDYLGISSVFATQTKPDLRRIWGLEGVKRLREISSLPLIGIGGIHEDNLVSVIQSGADGVALISDFRSSEDWKNKAERLRQRILNARMEIDHEH
ncbi:MAG: thiamine phosphate synthase [Bdellovibrionaceae bacterium]|nr:thiamine phosphate synthase [Pseudobdellovibrionaceae bacterium]